MTKGCPPTHSQIGKHYRLQNDYNVSTHPLYCPVYSTVVALTQITHAFIAENNTTKGKSTVPLKPTSIFYLFYVNTAKIPEIVALV